MLQWKGFRTGVRLPSGPLLMQRKIDALKVYGYFCVKKTVTWLFYYVAVFLFSIFLFSAAWHCKIQQAFELHKDDILSQYVINVQL